MAYQINADLVYDIIYAMTHVYTTENASFVVERPIREPRTLFSLPDHNSLPQNLVFGPTSMEERHFTVNLRDLTQSEYFCDQVSRKYFQCINVGPRFYPDLFLETQVYVCDERPAMALAIVQIC